MECLWISFFVLILGAFIILFAKPEYKAKIFSIFLMIGLGTAMVPAIESIINGSSLNVNVPYILFFQKLELVTDPFSAFITAFISVLGILYGLNILFTKNNKYKGNMLLLLVFTLLFLIFAINIQNGICFYLAFSLISILLLVFINSNCQKNMLKNLLVYLSGTCMTLILLILSIFSEGMQFTDMVSVLVSNKACSYLVFWVLFIGFGIPALLSEKLVHSDKLNEFKYFEPFFFWFLFYSLCFYSFLRFIGMGAVPSPVCQLICIALMIFYIALNIYKLLKTKDIRKTVSYTKTIHIIFSILALFVGVNGYITNNFNILIFGYLASLLFMVNTTICGYALQGYDEISENNCCNNRFVTVITTGSFAGIPATFGFWAWISFFFALISGFTSELLYIESLCIVMFVLSLMVFFVQIYKFFSILKEIGSTFFKNLSIKFNLILSAIIILLGIFFSFVFKLFVVPVSFFAGGTKFYDTFQALSKSVNVLSNSILFLVLLMLFFLLLKKLISKFSAKIH